MWDPNTYQRYADERSRPFVELLERVPAAAPRAVVDLGCGPGNLTATLAGRWPTARVTGVDSSVEMIEQARAGGWPVEFAVGDLRDWSPAPDVDVVVSNAALHWVTGHEELLVRWVGRLPAGAYLAVQVPGNWDAPSHRALRVVAAAAPWADRLGDAAAPRPVPDAEAYARLLIGAGCAVDAWETTYVHLLPSGGPRSEHPVLRWMEGTALRPVRAALDDGEWAEFRRRLGERLVDVYPVADGLVPFPFRRVFVVARTG
ncbi:MAG TPA: trans-aconitate 2-methyltransferase [Micromonosporaceae bacterium]|jgi:trans-aconitate 2-methyltransferase